MDGDVMAVGAATNNDRYNIDIGSIGLWYMVPTWNLQPTTTKSIFLLLLTKQIKEYHPAPPSYTCAVEYNDLSLNDFSYWRCCASQSRV